MNTLTEKCHVFWDGQDSFDHLGLINPSHKPRYGLNDQKIYTYVRRYVLQPPNDTRFSDDT